MFKHLFLLSTLILFGVFTGLQAQERVMRCGTYGEMAEPMIQRLLHNKAVLKNNPIQSRDFNYIPVRFHLVAKNDGSSAPNENKILDVLCAINEDYSDTGLQFYLKKNNAGEYFNYVKNTTIYENHQNAGFLMNGIKDNAALNIWVVNNAGDDSQGGQILGYYLPSLDWIVIRKDETSAQSATLPHEIGHFFSLDHPFNGWDADYYDPEVHGSPAPATSSGGSVPTELADSSNCETAGDYICDTPASYGEGYGWNGDCNYTGGHLDPNGNEINPEERLFMDYFLNCPRGEYYFTEEQTALMITDYNNVRRNYLKTGAIPNTTIIEENTALTSPINNEVTDGYNSVNFTWEAVPGATRYLLEISLVPTFTIEPHRIIVFGTSKEVSGIFQANKTYYWKVRPYSAYSTCIPSTAPESFKTNSVTGVNEIEFVNDWIIQPNPASAGSSLQVEINARNSFEGDINIYSVDGKLQNFISGQEFNAGLSTLNIPLNDLFTGLYIVSLETADGRLHKKLVVK